MNYKYQNNSKVILLKLFLVSLLVLGFFGCDNVLSEKFKDKEYTIAAIDNVAANWLAKDTLNDSDGITIRYKSRCGDSLKVRTLKSLVDTTTWGNYDRGSLTENQVYYQKFNEIADSLQPQTLIRDTLIIINPDDQKVTYARLDISGGQGKDIYLYTSLRYNSSNVSEYVSIELIKNDTASVSYSTVMSGETVSGSTQIISISQSKRIVPIIGARYQYHLEDGIYLVRFTTSNPTVGLFKITILSF
jgi:hypothetical protein